MKQYLLTIIAVLAAIILALFSIETANNQYSIRSYRTYSYNPTPNAWSGTGDGMLSVLQEDNTGSAVAPLTEANPTAGSLSALPEAGSPLGAPPAILATSAMTELTPVQLPPLDAGMVNVTGGFDGNGQTAGYRVNPRPGEFAIAVPYDPSLLPQGFTEDDIQTYVYDRQYHRWIAIQRDSVNEAELLVCSRFRPWEKGLSHTQNELANPQDALAQVQDMMSFASQGEGGGDSPLDFINAVLKTPEMPETSAYTPTSIKELKAADPLEGLTLMQPPTANNSGTANLSYPIEIPAGRQGMQPNLALTYSSGGGNGWLGVGWDISIPSITVETRWGVPRYDQSKESEVYVYEGEQLVTKDGNGNFREMPHRTKNWTNRHDLDQDGYEQFFPRKNEAFDSIVRHGTGPGNYWWTVTHKNGVTDYYGKYASDGTVNNSCVLRAGATNLTGPIAHWALAESVDPFGNSVRYIYSIEYHNGVQGSPNVGRQIYIDTIRYTVKDSDPGRYTILFTREQDRTDVAVSNNKGFKEVTASTLCNIAVCFNGRTIRHYFFKTECDRTSNFKTRLTDVVQLYKTSTGALPCNYLKELGVSDTIVTTHFDYYDLPEPSRIFGDTVSLSLIDDDIKSTFVTSGNIGTKATALGGTRGKSWNIGGTATVGAGPVVPLTTVSVGGNFNYSRSKSEGALTLIDLDGDGLADKVYKKGKKLFYRRHIADSEFHFHYDTEEHELKDYSDPTNPQSIRNFLSEVSSTTSWGLQLSIGLAYSGSWPTTKSTTSVYFADVNADGLPDLITDGGVLFNVTERDGIVKFRNYYTISAENTGTGNDSAFVHTTTDTCGGIIFNGEVSDSIVCQYEWVLDSTLWLKPIISAEDTALWFPVLRYADSLERTGEYRCEYGYYARMPEHIERIDIYRRVLVSCTPFPTSDAASEILERDPDLEAVRVWVAPKDGDIIITSNIRLIEDNSVSRQQSKTCDGVSFAIQHSSGVGVTTNHTLSASSPLNTSILDTGSIGASDYSMHSSVKTATVRENDLILFRLVSGENHDYDNVYWQQAVQYQGSSDIYYSDKDFVVSGNKCFGAGKPDPTGNNRMDVSFRISTGTIYPNLTSAKATLYVDVVDTTGYVCSSCRSKYTLANNMNNVPWSPLANTHIPENHHVKIYVTCKNKKFPWSLVRITPHINYYVDNGTRRDTIECYPQVDMQMKNHTGTVLDSVYHRLFGPLYRGWGQFAYHNNDTLPDGTIIHDDIIHLEKLVASWDNYPDKSNKANKRRRKIEGFHMTNQDSTHVRESSDMLETLSADTLYSPLSLKTCWVEMEPDFQHQAWIGYGNINYVTESTMCNTRMPGYYTDTNTVDIEDYDHPVPVVAQGQDVKTVRKQNYSKIKNHSLSLSAPGVPFSMGESVSEGYNLVLTDYMDLNGDRYPDVIGPSQVQYSQPWGGIGGVKPMGIFENGITRSETESGGTNFGGSFEMPSRCASNNPKNSKISFDGASNFGGNFGHGNDGTSMTWMDMNGDGLPDKVVRQNSGLGVYLNTGYGFLSKETYQVPDVREGSSQNFGLSIGGSFNIGQASIGGGLGVNFSRNETERMLMDFNGDGLPDMVENYNGNLYVSYNRGNGSWDSSEYVSGASAISFGRSFSESADASVTLGFTFFSALKVCVGISGSPYSRTFSKDSIQLTDINGDGYVDYVTSRNESSMTVRYNQSGKTNLLRKVTNFTGGTIELDYNMPLACYDKPQRSWNLASVETRNNVDTCPVGGNRTFTTFEYETPRYNRHERMDYGYGRVTTYQHNTDDNDNVYRYTVEEFNNSDFTKRGRKTRDCVYDADDNPYVEHLYSDTLYSYAGSVVEDNGCARTDIYVKKEVDITNWYEGEATPQITSMMEREYDQYRNVTKLIHYGSIDTWEEYFRAEISYAQNMPHNMVALPESIEVYDDEDSLLQKRTAAYYLNTGRLETLFLHGDMDTARYDFSYDTFGNMVSVTMPANVSGQRLVMQYQYDNTVHSYPTRVDNTSLGYYSTSEYDYRFGKPTRTVDINGNEMWYGYDSLGRTVTVTAPYEQGAAPYTIRMEYHPHNFGKLTVSNNSPNPYSYAYTFHYDRKRPNNPIRTTLITDGMGRLMQTKKDAEIGGQEVSLITGKIVYDCFGRTVEQYHPFSENLGTESVYNDSVTIGTATVMEYDMMDRQKRVTQQPYGYTTTMDYYIDFRNNRMLFGTYTTDANGNSTLVSKGTLGQEIARVAPDNTETIFRYDPLGRLEESEDPDGNITYYEYDKLGRMVHRTHPDAGEDWYKYDPAGNVIFHVNGNGDTVRNKYHYNLLTDIVYPRYPANNVHYVYGAFGAADNCAGKILFQEDASGWQTFKYGKLGELTENTRTFVLPYESVPYTFRMRYAYDSWNRIDSMTYPDGEVVCYEYNKGGMLQSIHGHKGGSPRVYISDIRYNRFELKDSVSYGNGTRTHFAYDSLLRLSHLSSWDANGDTMQSIGYTYDDVGNITDIANTATMLPNGLGGDYNSHYYYDQQYRLSSAYGDWGGNQLGFNVSMGYHNNGRIAQKLVYADVLNHLGNTNTVSYNNTYYYNSSQPNVVTSISGSSGNQFFDWDAAGNMVYHQDENSCERFLCWDEENRLTAFSDCNGMGIYQYDAGGERTYKRTSRLVTQNIQGHWATYSVLNNPTLYVSPYLVATPKGYTKHYYAESERVASRTGAGMDSVNLFLSNLAAYRESSVSLNNPLWQESWTTEEVFLAKYDTIEWQLDHVVYECLWTYPNVVFDSLNILYSYANLSPYQHENEPDCYWYHPDHLGSSSWITYSDGSAIQHLHYLPWGEDFVDQRSTNWNAMYTFSAKEKDTETGYSYFGSRYYSSDLSIWLSVDPMSDSIPYLTPYNYCKNSPILMKDPNGEFPWLVVWGLVEAGLAIYDAYQTGTTIVDPNASIGQKAASVGGFLLGAVLPGGGYGSGAKFGVKQAERLIKAGVTTGKRIDNIGGFASRELLKEHYIKHGKEFGGKFKNADEYLKGAQNFFKRESSDIIQYTRKNGDIVRYDMKNNIFGVADKNGNIRTMFKPDDGVNYLKKQIKTDLGIDGL